MKDPVLEQFRDMAADFSLRDQMEIMIELKNGTVLNAKYDPFFSTVTLGGSTFPVSELNVWTRLGWGSKVVRVIKRLKSPVSPQAMEN